MNLVNGRVIFRVGKNENRLKWLLTHSRKIFLSFLNLSRTFPENDENLQILNKPIVIRLTSYLDFNRLHPLFSVT